MWRWGDVSAIGGGDGDGRAGVLLLAGYFLIKRNEIFNFIISLRRHKLFYLVTSQYFSMYLGDISGRTKSNVNIRCNSVALCYGTE